MQQWGGSMQQAAQHREQHASQEQRRHAARSTSTARARSAARACEACGCATLQAASAAAGQDAPAEKKLWGGRFTGKTDPLMEKFNESLPFDKRMWAEDIRVRWGARMPGCAAAGLSILPWRSC